jgi:hypothetical protein
MLKFLLPPNASGVQLNVEIEQHLSKYQTKLCICKVLAQAVSRTEGKRLHNCEIVIGEFWRRSREPTLWDERRWLGKVESGAIGDVLTD